MSLIKLEIAKDYPVNWTFERILRDLIQNFYDSIGSERFGAEFIYSYKKSRRGMFSVTMKTTGYPFSYEWLSYIGGSTKTSSPEKYIGKYGEGFKMCMLSLLKLGISDVTMHSQNWKISPCTYTEKIGGKKVKMLGYQKKKCLERYRNMGTAVYGSRKI